MTDQASSLKESIERQRLSLEADRLEFERTKFHLDYELRVKELGAQKKSIGFWITIVVAILGTAGTFGAALIQGFSSNSIKKSEQRGSLINETIQQAESDAVAACRLKFYSDIGLLDFNAIQIRAFESVAGQDCVGPIAYLRKDNKSVSDVGTENFRESLNSPQ